MPKQETYSGFIIDWLKDNGLPVTTSSGQRLGRAARKAGCRVYQTRYHKENRWRTYMEAAPVDVLRAAVNLHTPEPETPDAVAQLRQLVSTLNAVVDQLEAERAVSNALRLELARLSVKARSAMVVYGD